MDTTDIVTVARHLFETQGPKAIAEAARNAARLNEAGDAQQARMWERVEAALRELRGPRQS
jgi:hypothetical protein